jgi:hypothetical protein
MRRAATRGAAACALALSIVVVIAGPAGAHGVAGVQPSNYETRVRSVVPSLAGISVRPVDLGDALELTNTTDRDVVVLGYDDEPALRVGPRGAYENRRSPATYLNRSRLDPPTPPASADPDAPPSWHRIGAGPTVRWHDHRAHWMGSSDPPAVARHPDRRQLVQRFRIRLLVGDRPAVVRGEVLWVPGPAGWPLLLVAAALAGALGLAGRTRWWRYVLIAGLAVLVVSESAHLGFAWPATTASSLVKLGASAYAVGSVAVAALALVLLVRRRDPYDATPAALFAGIGVALTGGLVDVTSLFRSQLPTELDPTLARLAVTLALGLGAGIAIVAALHLRRPRRRRVPTDVRPHRTVPAGV